MYAQKREQSKAYQIRRPYSLDIRIITHLLRTSFNPSRRSEGLIIPGNPSIDKAAWTTVRSSSWSWCKIASWIVTSLWQQDKWEKEKNQKISNQKTCGPIYMIFSMPTWINTEKCTRITVCQANLTQPPHQDYNTESWQSSQYWLYKARNSSATELENVKNKEEIFCHEIKYLRRNKW